MNPHVLVLHFPIALLTVYTAMEVLRFRRLTSQSWWLPVKAFLSILGALSAGASFLSGKFIEDAFERGPLAPLLEAHELAAFLTTGIFGLIALYYLWTAYCAIKGLREPKVPPILLILAALLGFAFLSITGALGGAMAFGPDVDPLSRFLYDLLMP